MTDRPRDYFAEAEDVLDTNRGGWEDPAEHDALAQAYASLAIAQQISRIADALTQPATGGIAPSPVPPEAAARLAGSARAAEEAAR